MRAVLPTRMKGAPAAPIPAALIGPPRSDIGYHVDGVPSERCGSLARSGLPVVVWRPAIAHSFEPVSLP